MRKIITVGREFGSGGREFGRRLAEELGFEYYDKEIITEIAKSTSLSENYVRQVVEHEPHRLYPITIGQTIPYVGDYAFRMEQSVYQAQRKILLEMAEKSDCVIVGRCADYVLRDLKPMRIFVYADMQSRVARCMARGDGDHPTTEKELIRQIKKIDKNRAKYYEYYTGQKWGAKENYDLCINTTDTVIKDVVVHVAKML